MLPARRHRLGHPPRLRGWDYARPAPYFVTFNVAGRTPCLARLARLADGGVVLTRAGEVVRQCWNDLPVAFPGLGLDALVIMPDHVHAILWIPCGPLIHQGPASPADHPCGALIHQGPPSPAAVPGEALIHQGPTRSTATASTAAGPGFRPLMAAPGPVLGKVVRRWKAASTHRIRRDGRPSFAWQSRYYEHVVRSPGALARIRAYIRDNPQRAT